MQLEDALNFDTLTANTATGDDLLYAYDRDTNTVRTISFGQALSLFGGGIASGAPAAAAPGSGTLNPAGADNSVLIESTNAAVLSASIAIEEDGLVLTAARVGSNISIVSGDKRIMRVTADFGDGVETQTFVLSGLDSNGFGIWVWDDWTLQKLGGGNYGLSDTVTDYTADIVTDFPDDESITWEDGPVTPTVTAHPATAEQVIAAVNAASITGITADDGAGSDGSGFVAATSTAITAPTAATGGSPPLRFDSTKLYVNVGTEAAPVWKDLTFNT